MRKLLFAVLLIVFSTAVLAQKETGEASETPESEIPQEAEKQKDEEKDKKVDTPDDEQEEPKIVTIRGKSQIEWNPEIESRGEAKERALQRAKVDALKKAFGQLIIQGNSTYVKNVQTGEKAETQSVFNMIGESSVKGEIIELQKKKFTPRERKERVGSEMKTFYYMDCKIKALARELTAEAVKFQAFPLSGDTKNNRTDRFNEGDDVYFYFRSPVTGYISIYVDISGSGITQRILPYQYVPSDFESGMPVEADKEYIFFSGEQEHEYYPERAVQVDEIMAFPDNDNELWRFFVVFSRKPIVKPMLDNPGPEKQDGKIKWELPKKMVSEDFQRWKIKQQSTRKDVQVKVIDAIITK